MPNSRARSRRAARAIRHQRRQRARVALLIAALVAVAGIGALILASRGSSDGATVAELQLIDFAITGDLEVPAGEVRLHAVNEGAQPHNVGIRGGPISNHVGTGGTISLDLGELEPGTYELYCDVTGHEELGMIAPFVVAAPEVEP